MTARELSLECLATIEAARQAVAEGAVLDLTGFDAEIERLCVSAALLPAEERIATAQELPVQESCRKILLGWLR